MIQDWMKESILFVVYQNYWWLLLSLNSNSLNVSQKEKMSLNYTNCPFNSEVFSAIEREHEHMCGWKRMYWNVYMYSNVYTQKRMYSKTINVKIHLTLFFFSPIGNVLVWDRGTTSVKCRRSKLCFEDTEDSAQSSAFLFANIIK